MSPPRRALHIRYRIEPETVSLGDRTITHAAELPDETWHGSFHPQGLAGADPSGVASPVRWSTKLST